MPDERDTQFAGFAKLLFEEMKPDLTLLLIEVGNKNAKGIASAEAIIQQYMARRAHDFMRHVLANTNSFEFGMYGDDYVIEKIPDMTQWPGEG